jgi:hypothetical protein
VLRNRNGDATGTSSSRRYRPPVVRTRSRSHNSRLALAALGLLAVLVALSGGPSSGPVAEAAPGRDPIRSVDFADVSQPGSACRQGLSITPPKRIAVDAGKSGLLDLGRLTRLEVDRAVTYGDLDGDGHAEAVVHAVCTFGANGAQDTVQVWRMDGSDPVLVASLSEPPAKVTGPFPPAVKRITVANARMSVTWTHYAGTDPNCCPSRQTVIRYRLDDGALRQVGKPVTTDATG